MQLRHQGLLRAGGDRAGRNGVAGPGDDGGHDQQNVVVDAIFLDLHRFGQGFGLFDQDLVCAHVALGEVVQGRFQGGILPRLQQLRNRYAKLVLPEHVFEAAARAVERLGKRDQFGGVTGEAGSGLAAGSGHNFGERPVSVQLCSLTPGADGGAHLRRRGATTAPRCD